MKRLLIAWVMIFVSGASTFAAELGDDGLHKATWMRDTFKDLSEDLEEANSEGKRLMVIIEQRGCIYCKKMHEEVFSTEKVSSYIEENYFVVQINMFGDVEVTDFDGSALPEKEIVTSWGTLFTPTILFFPEKVADDQIASQAAVATMPGAFSQGTTLDLLTWVVEKGYEGGESFQKYHARMIAERSN